MAKKRSGIVAGGLALALMISSSGCATIFHGPVEKRDRGGILWGYVLLQIFPSNWLFLLIDFLTGAIYSERIAAAPVRDDSRRDDRRDDDRRDDRDGR